MRLFQVFDRLVTSRIAVGLVLFVLLALLIWYGGPKLSIDGSEPLATQANRLIAIAALAVVFLGLEALRRWRLDRLNRRILSSLESLDEASGPAGGIGRVRESHAMLCEALRTRGGARLRNRRHLYEQPWYLVLGEPGSGRFAALANSGMEFVIDAGSLVRVPGSVPGRGGECGWWVADEAVFVVPPAEFVTEPGPTQAAEWNDLLDCLKSARRRHPLNGIILTIPATCMPFEAISLDVAIQMRERVQEVMARFSMTLPIYVLVTKCDRIAGFSEFFSDLDAEDRARPLGATLPPGRPRPAFGGMRGADAFAAGASAVSAYAERYREFIASLAAWMPSRLETERQADRRRRIFAFPQQMQAFGEVRRWIGDSREAEVSDLRRVVMVQPGALRRMLDGLADQSTAILMESARRHLERRWRDTVLAECRRAISDRYPIDRKAETPIAPDDFEAFFARDGAVDRFFSEQIAPFVDTAGATWEERSIHGWRLGLRDAALEMFRNAITIRNAFGLHAATLAEAGFTIEPVYLDSQAVWIAVETNHGSFTYRHEPPRRFRMTLAGDAVSISMTDRTGNTHASRLNVPWAWVRAFDRHRLQSAGVADQHDFTVGINGLEAVFRVSADSTVNPLTAHTLTDFRCEESLL